MSTLDLREDHEPEAIEELEQKLYSSDERKVPRKRPGVLHRVAFGSNASWTEEKSTEHPQFMNYMPKTSIFKKFFVVAVVFFVAAMAFAAYMFLGGTNTVSTQNIDIKILGNAFTNGGDELPLQIEIKNQNAVALDRADLLIEYPKSGGGDPNVVADTVRIRKSLGTIAAGQMVTDVEKVTLYGEQGSTRDIKATLEYRLKGSNAIFIKETAYKVNINSAPLTLSVDAPTTANANQDITLKIKATLNAGKPAQGIVLEGEYPPGFVFKRSDPRPITGNNVWDLGNLEPGVEKNITITGSIIADSGEDKSFHFYAGEGSVNSNPIVSTVYNSVLQTISITKPFLEAKLAINDNSQAETVASAQSPIRGKISWSNNLSTQIMNAEIHATLSGNAFDKAGVQTSSGFYNSLTNEIIWDRNTIPSFASIEPGETGTVDFSLMSLPLIGSSNIALVNPQIVIDVSIKGQEPSGGSTVQEVNNFEHKVVKMNSDFQLVAHASRSTGPFTNTGPLPPKAEQESTYTITWTVTNSANRIVQADARATLPPVVKWKNMVFPKNENISYDPSTNTIDWKIGTVEKGTGFSGAAREVSFQVGLTPSDSQVGSVPLLLNETSVTGTDTFTNTVFSFSKKPLNTFLVNDPAFLGNAERVVR